VTPATPSPRKRVVCHLIERLEHGGAESLVHTLASRTPSGNYTSIVCCLQLGPLTARFESDGIRVHCLKVRRRSLLEGPLFLVFVFKLIFGLRRVIETEQVSIIHAHLQDSIIWAAVVGAITRTPVIGTYHGLGIIPVGRQRLDPRNWLRRALYRLAGRWTDRTVAVSGPVRDVLCQQIGLDERKTVLILNGIDTRAVGRVAGRGRSTNDLEVENRTVIICVGRLVAGKGQRFLIDAMPEIVARFPTSVLLLVGEGPDRRSLEEHARAINTSAYVRFAGQRDDVPELLALSTIFVLPSFSEGIPLALIEAMAAGKPVVATAVSGNLDVVLDDRYGVLVPPRDARALATAICALLADGERAAAMAANGQARVQMHFDINRSIGATIALYDEVLAERQHSLQAVHP